MTTKKEIIEAFRKAYPEYELFDETQVGGWSRVFIQFRKDNTSQGRINFAPGEVLYGHKVYGHGANWTTRDTVVPEGFLGLLTLGFFLQSGVRVPSGIEDWETLHYMANERYLKIVENRKKDPYQKDSQGNIRLDNEGYPKKKNRAAPSRNLPIYKLTQLKIEEYLNASR